MQEFVWIQSLTEHYSLRGEGLQEEMPVELVSATGIEIFQTWDSPSKRLTEIMDILSSEVPSISIWTVALSHALRQIAAAM